MQSYKNKHSLHGYRVPLNLERREQKRRSKQTGPAIWETLQGPDPQQMTAGTRQLTPLQQALNWLNFFLKDGSSNASFPSIDAGVCDVCKRSNWGCCILELIGSMLHFLQSPLYSEE